MAVATQVNDVPPHAGVHGFRTSTFGTIIARPIMVEDLRQILAACQPSASLEEYTSAAIDQNVLGKPTASGRRYGFRNLCEFWLSGKTRCVAQFLTGEYTCSTSPAASREP